MYVGGRRWGSTSLLFCQNLSSHFTKRMCLSESESAFANRWKLLHLEMRNVYKWKIFLGPTCGLCALSMMYQGFPSAESLLRDAINHKYTNNGEMFSAVWLLELLKINLPASTIKPDKVRAYLYDGSLNSDFIKEKLKQHAMLLVPYDADKNHAPCNNNGHKAHWCLICGYLIEDNNDVSWMIQHRELSQNSLHSTKYNFLRANIRCNYNCFLFARVIKIGQLINEQTKIFIFFAFSHFFAFRFLILVSRFRAAWEDKKLGFIFVEGLKW